jgi:methyltransferase-like protein 6
VARDYGLYDMAMLKMAEPRKSKISDNFYVRGDGTRAYFFSEEELEALFREAGFETVELEMHRRVVKNRKQSTEMHRRWVQGRFRKLP